MSAADVAARLLREVVRTSPKAEAIAQARFGRRQNVRFAAGDITTSGASDDDDVSLTVAIGKRHATLNTNQTDDASLVALAQRAVAMAKLAPEDAEWMPVLGPATFAQNRGAFDPATRDQPPEERARVARSSLDAAKQAGVTVAGFLETTGHERCLATTAGLSATFAESRATFTVTARTPDGTGSGWAGAEDARAGGVDALSVSRVAIDKATRSKAPRPLEPGRYDVILEPAAVADIVGFLVEGMDARGADEGRSFFSRKTGTALGERLFAPEVTLRSDPTDATSPAAPFDGEGLPLSPITWIDKGTLSSLRTSRFWAKKQGRQPTGGHSTWLLSGGAASTTDDLVRTVERGLVVTRFWYCRWLDPKELIFTGLTRDGVFLVENGKITSPVNNFRFNESPSHVLSNLIGMTSQTIRVPSYGGVMRVPFLATKAFNMASVSAAI